MRQLLAILLLAGAIALGTTVGWWMVPLVGLGWGLLGAGRRSPQSMSPVLGVTIAAGLAWAGWLGYDAMAGEGGLGRLGARLGPVFHVPFPVLIVVTIGFPMLLAATAASVGAGLGAAVAGPNRGSR